MRHVRNLLALFGALALLGGVTAWTSRRIGYVEIVGRVLNTDQTPIPSVAVYLDRGTNIIERYVADSTGLFRLPLFPREPHRATWLICVPGMSPTVGKPELDHLGSTYYTYQPAQALDSVWRFYRASGWSGPIPRECPRGADDVGWRYPASAGKDWGSYSTSEPDWRRYPGPPVLPK
jgi:hypothetical protein